MKILKFIACVIIGIALAYLAGLITLIIFS